jgi:SAM-dependent methyltransferase
MSMNRFNKQPNDGQGEYEAIPCATRPFTPRRYSTRDVFRDLALEVEADGVRCKLIALNFEFMAVTSRAKVQLGEMRTVVIRAAALKNTPVLFEGQGEVVDVITDSFGSEFDLKFSKMIDFEALSKEAAKLNTRQVLNDHPGIQADALPQEYAMLSVELMHHLSGLRIKATALEQFMETRNPEEVFHQARRLMSTYSETFRDLWYRFNDVIALIPYDDPRFLAIKWHTDHVLRPLFMGAPVFSRSYEKPLGYPGDYQVMLYAYDFQNPVETPTLYDAVLQQYFSNGFGACIRGRLEMAVNAILNNLKGAQTSPDKPYEILNVGCGAAVELPALLSHRETREKFMHIRLLDQDDRPLQYAYQNLAKATYEHKNRKQLSAYRMSFIELYQSGRLTREEHIGPQDVIYSLGLLDYFRQGRAKRFVSELYSRVKPGGLLIVCNVAKTREGCEWILECLTDWRLEYRTQSDMDDIFDGLPGDPDINLELEPSGQMWVAVIRKPEQ